MKIESLLVDTRFDRSEAEIILAQILGKDRSFLFAHPEFKVSPTQVRKLKEYVKRRSQNEPLAYILGYKEFYGLNFYVNKNVLIPRPVSEVLIEKILDHIKVSNLSNLIICDVGTGSGCIAISLAKLLPKTKICATDISKAALKVARRNAKLHKVDSKITFLQGDLLSPLAGKLDIIVANLPYVKVNQINKLPPEISEWEPRIALDGGADGMSLYRRLFAQAKNFLNRNGVIFYEFDGKIHKWGN